MKKFILPLILILFLIFNIISYCLTDLCTGGSCIESGHYTTNVCAFAFDENATTRWTINSSTGYIGYNFSVAETVKQYRICSHFANQGPKDWTFQGSATGNWGGEEVTLATESGETGWGAGEVRTFYCSDNATAYEYYRINITDSETADWVQIREIDMYEEGIGITWNTKTITKWNTVTITKFNTK